jgi:transposase
MTKAGTRTDREGEEARRLQAIDMLLEGMSQVDVAEDLGVHHHTVSHWMAIYRAKGKPGLRWSGREGRPALLDDGKREQLKKILVRGPSSYGYSIGLWTLPRIAAVIEKEFGVSYSEPHVWRILQDIGWSCQRPTKRAIERDERKVTEWKRKTWPALKKTPNTKAKQ